VLDEATGALDAITEHEIDVNLRRRGCSCLIVAHRLSTVRDCDQILVMEHGVIVERGSHDDLVARGELYRALVTAG
jgi:ABC-type multidrug transport system fused ATPase/permease subunit